MGFRNDTLEKNPDIVFIGNSFIYGTGLTQKNILSNKIKQFLPSGIKTYKMAPSSIGQLDHFIKKNILKKPKVLVYCFIDREPTIGYVPFESSEENPATSFVKSLFYAGLNRFTDKALRCYSLRYLKGLTQPVRLGSKDEKSGWYFGYCKGYPKPDKHKSNNFVANIKRDKDYCASKGIKFYYLFTPSKELVYADKLHIEYKRKAIYDIDRRLKSEEIDGLNPLDAFLNARRS